MSTHTRERHVSVSYLRKVLGCTHWANTLVYSCEWRLVLMIGRSQVSFEIRFM